MKKVIIILLVCIITSIPVFASETVIPDEELSSSLDTIISQNEESIQILTNISFDINFIIVITLISIAFFLASKFIKKIAIKILNNATKGMSL